MKTKAVHEVGHELIWTNGLSAKERVSLVRRVSSLYRWYAPSATDQKIAKRLFENPHTFIDLLTSKKSVIAFGVYVMKELTSTGEAETCLWRHGVIINPDHHSQGYYKRMLGLALNRHTSDWTATQTQNPRVYETWFGIFGNQLSPRPEQELSPLLRKVANEVVGTRHPFDAESFVIKDAYPENRSGAAYRECRTPWITEFFKKKLGVHDSLLLLVRR